MNKVIINNIPSSNRKDFGYRTINSSEVHNQNQQEMLDDILDLFNKANAIERVINENMDFIKTENSYLESVNHLLLEKYKDLKNKYENLLNDEDYRCCIALPQDCEIYDENFGAVIDKVTSDITVRPSKKISKLAIFDSVTDSMFLPDTLSVSIRTPKKGIISEVDNDIYAPFYKDNNLYWTRKVTTDNTVEKLTTEYVINLPEEIMTTPEMNEIVIQPFLCRVAKVYGRYGDSNAWELVPGQEYHTAMEENDTLEGFINSGRKFRLNFPNQRYNQLKIVVVCESFTECETNLRTFSYGIKQIGAYINYYNSYEQSSFQFEVDIPEYDSYMITGVEPHFNNGGEYGKFSKDFICDLYYKDSSGYFHKIVDTFPFTPKTNTIRVRCRFGESYPDANIKKILVKYKKMK